MTLPLLSLVLACANDPVVPDQPAHHHHEVAAAAPLDGASIYQLGATWQDQQGSSVTLATFRGRPVVLAMVYTHCEHACPRIIGDMRAISASLGEDAGPVGFVLVSIDPDRDTVDRLGSFADETGLDEAGWTLLRGDAGAVRELAAVLGVSYRRVGASDFAHTNLVTVLDSEGLVVHRQEGLGVEPTTAVGALRPLLRADDG